MGFRFNKRIKIAKGVHLNLSKKGISTSVKVGGVTFNSRGRISASIPKTGISYSTNLGTKKKKAPQNNKPQEYLPKPKNKYVALILCVVLGYFGAHKFYEGKIGMGILYFFTFGLGFIGVIYDFVKLLSKDKIYYPN